MRGLIAANHQYTRSVPLDERYHPGYDYYYLYKQMQERGVDVRTRVIWGTTLEHPESHLLKIETIPIQGHYFPTTRPTNVEWSPWHVSLCYQTDPMTAVDLDHIIRKFDNHTFKLFATAPEGSMLVLDRTRDPIASDPTVQSLHDEGSYWYAPIHISA